MPLKLMKYPGAKTVMLPDIRKVFWRSGAKVLVDVFGGSGLVSLNIDAPSIVYNDIDYDLVMVFMTLQRNPRLISEILSDIMKLVEISKRQYKDGNRISEQGKKYKKDEIQIFDTLYRFTTSFGGMGSTYSTGNEKSKVAFLKKVRENLDQIEHIVSRWTIENLDFKELMEKYDRPGIFFYLDPPYSGKKWYNSALTVNDYLDLKRRLEKTEAKYLMNIDLSDRKLIRIFGNPSFVKTYRNENGKPGMIGGRFKAFYTNT